MEASVLEFYCLVDDLLERHRSALFLFSFPAVPRNAFSVQRHAVVVPKLSPMYRFLGDFI